jgi:ZPR1 zinc finger protein
LDAFIEKLKEYRDGMQLPFTFELVDPSGNSFI